MYWNTATPSTTIALWKGENLLAQERWKSAQDEAEKLQLSIERMLKRFDLLPEQIDRLIVCIGPGGFTGTRIGVSAANAWSFALDVPISTVTVFDLFEAGKVILILTANRNQAWIQAPGFDPKFVEREEWKVSSAFSFGGLVDSEWKEDLMNRGGKFVELEERLPRFQPLEFRSVLIRPWYYKEANITWSAKIYEGASSQPVY